MLTKLKKYQEQGKIRIIYQYDENNNFLIIPQTFPEKMESQEEWDDIWNCFDQSLDEQIQKFDVRRVKNTSFAGALASFVGKEEVT